MKLFVAGGTGAVGTDRVPLLIAQQDTVVVLCCCRYLRRQDAQACERPQRGDADTLLPVDR